MNPETTDQTYIEPGEGYEPETVGDKFMDDPDKFSRAWAKRCEDILANAASPELANSQKHWAEVAGELQNNFQAFLEERADKVLLHG